MEEPSAAFESMGLQMRGIRNWAGSIFLVSTTASCSAYWLGTTPFGATGNGSISEPLAIVFHVVVAVIFIWVVLLMLRDPIPLQVKYTVPGREEIPEVVCGFVHLGRLTTFTLWCNLLGCLYYCLAAVAGILAQRSTPASPTFARVLEVLWEIVFPMSFLVNIVVSFVLIPALKKGNRSDRLWFILKWRPQILHNGFVLAAALEAAFVGPCLHLAHFPVLVLYGNAYIIFAWLVFKRARVFHYFFMDPRFAYAPCAQLALLLLLSGIYALGAFAVKLSAGQPIVKVLILLAALGTCTFRDGKAHKPDEATLMQGG